MQPETPEVDEMEKLKATACPRRKIRTSETAAIRNPLYGFGPLTHTDDPAIQTPFDLVLTGAKLHPNSPLFGTRDSSQPGRPYVFRSYADALKKILTIAAGMRARFGIKPGDRIGVFSRTREEFHILLFICGVLRCIVVPIYESIGPNAVAYIIRHSGVRVIFAAEDKLRILKQCLDALDAETAASVSPAVSPVLGESGDMAELAERQEARKKAAAVRAALLAGEGSWEQAWRRPEVVTLDGPTDKELADCTFAEIEAAGVGLEPPKQEEFAKSDDIHVIMYTSGTTGLPKGVMLTHCATLGSGMAISQKIPKAWKSVQLRVLSFMPLAHVFGLAIDYTVLRTYGCIGFYSGSIKDIVSDIQALQPTALGGVPRVFQRIRDGIMAEVAKQNAVKRFAFNMAYMQKLWWLRAGQKTPYTDPMFFGTIREKLGGKLQILVGGGACLPPHVMEWFRVVVCDHFLEGYGATETCAVGVSTDEDPSVVVNAGQYAPYFNSEVKLVSVPEMNYLVTDKPPRGELCIRTTSLMLGYYKDPEKTAEVIDEDGWLHTGDVALIQSNNRIRIIDRIRSMFKLCQGEYLSAEYIEQVLASSPAIHQAFVCGNSDQRFPIAIVVPDCAYFQEWAVAHGLEEKAADINALSTEKSVIEHVQSEVVRVSKESQLKGYEFVKNIFLFPKNFEEMDDFMTPSLKLKRHIIRRYFQKELEQLYAQGPQF